MGVPNPDMATPQQGKVPDRLLGFLYLTLRRWLDEPISVFYVVIIFGGFRMAPQMYDMLYPVQMGPGSDVFNAAFYHLNGHFRILGLNALVIRQESTCCKISLFSKHLCDD